MHPVIEKRHAHCNFGPWIPRARRLRGQRRCRRAKRSWRGRRGFFAFLVVELVVGVFEHRPILPRAPPHPLSLLGAGAALPRPLRVLRWQCLLQRRCLQPLRRWPLVHRGRELRRLSTRLQRILRVPPGSLSRSERLRLHQVDLQRIGPVVPEPRADVARLRLSQLLIVRSAGTLSAHSRRAGAAFAPYPVDVQRPPARRAVARTLLSFGVFQEA